MKYIIPSIFSIASLTLITSCEKKEPKQVSGETISQPEEMIEYTAAEEELLKDVNEMFETKDVSNMMRRSYKHEGITELNIEIQKEYFENIVKKGMSSFELERINPPETEHKDHDGAVTKWSLPLKWKLIIHEPKHHDEFNVSYLIHLSDCQGKIVIIRELAP
jgi:hypothetical protein